MNECACTRKFLSTQTKTCERRRQSTICFQFACTKSFCISDSTFIEPIEKFFVDMYNWKRLSTKKFFSSFTFVLIVTWLIMKFSAAFATFILLSIVPLYLEAAVCPKCLTKNNLGIETTGSGTTEACFCYPRAPYGSNYLTKVTTIGSPKRYCCHTTDYCPTCPSNTPNTCQCHPKSPPGTRKQIFSIAGVQCCYTR